jgi:hypothetical protein
MVHESYVPSKQRAQTCDNTLEVPNYWEAYLVENQISDMDCTATDKARISSDVQHILRKKLLQAATMCGSYGLDGFESEPDPMTQETVAAVEVLQRSQSAEDYEDEFEEEGT